MEQRCAAPRPKGRPCGFSESSALEGAMRAFWASGYDGVSIDTLCRASQMSRASLYNRFGGKDALFLAAIAYYTETRLRVVVDALGPQGTLKEDLTAFFAQVVQLGTSDPQTPGCLISCVLSEAAGSNQTYHDELERRYIALERRIAVRLKADDCAARGAVPLADAAALTAAMARGIILRARSGQSHAQLAPVGDAAAEAIVRLSC
ncbi:TetR/AcrR family transcriptional regulator [Pseudooceanicola algae]|nr:TetR/AcrR family transcriptional regulator [Pseudooceanicola algae]